MQEADRTLLEKVVKILNGFHIEIEWGQHSADTHSELVVLLNAANGRSAILTIVDKLLRHPDWRGVEVHRDGQRIGKLNAFGQITINREDGSPEKSGNLTFRVVRE